jgi:predicted PurR-regulated permease PerM
MDMRLPESRRQRAQLFVAALGIALLLAIAPFASGLLGGLVLYVAVVPAHRWLTRAMKPRIAATIVVTATVILLILPGIWLLAAVVDQTPAVVRGGHEALLRSRAAAVRVGGVDLGTQLTEVTGVVVSWLSRRAIDAIGGVMRGSLNLVIALFGLYYLLLSASRAWTWLRSYLPFSASSAEQLRSRFVLVTEATLIGTALTALLQGSIVGLGFWIVGLPNPLFWGAITALVSILPVLGSSLVWLPGVLVLFAQGRFNAALVLAAIGGIIASNIDNFTRPMVNKRLCHLHPMTTLVGAFAGVGVFGLVGLLLGPLAISYFFELLEIQRRESAANAHAAGIVAAPPDAAAATFASQTPVTRAIAAPTA